MAELKVSPEELKPLLIDIVRAVLDEHDRARRATNGSAVLTEAEAASFLGLNPWQLRDLRLSGKLSYHRIVGGRIRYTLDDLLAYLRQCRREGTA